MANHQAKVAAYESTSRRYERRARQAIQTLREQLDKAERRINSADELDRQLVSSSGTEIAREASALAESAAAWVALREVAYFTEPETDQQWTALKDFLTKERRAHHEIVAECDGAELAATRLHQEGIVEAHDGALAKMHELEAGQ